MQFDNEIILNSYDRIFVDFNFSPVLYFVFKADRTCFIYSVVLGDTVDTNNAKRAILFLNVSI